MKHLKIEDIERLSREVGASTNDSDEWCERVGLDPELLSQIGNVATQMAHEKTIARARKEFEEAGFDINNLDDAVADNEGIALKMDIGDVIKEACISMFALGFETHKQYGSS